MIHPATIARFRHLNDDEISFGDLVAEISSSSGWIISGKWSNSVPNQICGMRDQLYILAGKIQQCAARASFVSLCPVSHRQTPRLWGSHLVCQSEYPVRQTTHVPWLKRESPGYQWGGRQGLQVRQFPSLTRDGRQPTEAPDDRHRSSLVLPDHLLEGES